MPILALDTSTTVSTVAIATENRILAEVTMQLKIPQSEVLLQHIKDALKIARVDRKDLEAIALSIGPGSFTGLRIGLTTAKMLSYALNIPVVTVSSLTALSYHYPVPNVYVASTLDAQKGNAYFELSQWNIETQEMEIIQPVTVRNFQEILEYCSALDKPVYIVGDIAQQKASIIAQEEYNNVYLGLPNLCMPRASNVITATRRKLAEKDFANIMDLEPVYIRRSEAEVLWEQRHPQQG